MPHLNLTCIILGCASCHVYVMFVYRIVCLFPVCFFSLVPVTFRSVRIRSTTLVRLLHGFDLLQSGIPGKMIITLDIITSFALLDVSMLSFGLATYHMLICLPIAMIKPLTSTILANLCLAMLPLAQPLL